MKFRCIEVALNYFENSLSRVPSLIPICYCSDLLSRLVLACLGCPDYLPQPPCFNITAAQQLTTHPDMMSREYRTHLKMPLLRHCRQGSGKLEKNLQVENWVQGAINWMSST